jgi:hypothetical protein
LWTGFFLAPAAAFEACTVVESTSKDANRSIFHRLVSYEAKPGFYQTSLYAPTPENDDKPFSMNHGVLVNLSKMPRNRGSKTYHSKIDAENGLDGLAYRFDPETIL